MDVLYNYIFSRKSIRKYKTNSLSDELLTQIRDQIKSLKPLYADINTKIEITDKVKNLIMSKAPYYLIFSSEIKEGYLENAGFMLEQLSLYLSSKKIGSCWLGMAKPAKKSDSELEFVISMSFGYPDEEIYRKVSDFNRKALKNISEGSDQRLEAARLAPSGMNSQNWYFVSDNGMIHVYRRKVNLIKAVIYNKMNCIDTGIALCHIYMASETFDFKKLDNYPCKKDFIYMGTVL